MGLDNFRDGVQQPQTISTEAIAIRIPVSVVFTNHTVKSSGDFNELLDLHWEDISDALQHRTDAKNFDIHIDDAEEIPIEDATWD